MVDSCFISIVVDVDEEVTGHNHFLTVHWLKLVAVSPPCPPPSFSYVFLSFVKRGRCSAATAGGFCVEAPPKHSLTREGRSCPTPGISFSSPTWTRRCASFLPSVQPFNLSTFQPSGHFLLSFVNLNVLYCFATVDFFKGKARKHTHTHKHKHITGDGGI